MRLLDVLRNNSWYSPVSSAMLERATTWNIFCFLIFSTVEFSSGNIPAFYAFNVIEQVVFLPKDVEIGTPVYRFRTSDSACQGKLSFGTKNGRQPSDIIKMVIVDDCTCVCDVDAILIKELKAKTICNVTVFVKDSVNQQGETTFRINVTDSRSNPKTVFSDFNSTIRVLENTPVETTIGYVLAKNYYNGYYRLVDLKLKGSETFRLFSRAESEDKMRGNIILASPLDYEKQTFYEIGIVAYNGYVERPIDTRNIINLTIFVVVEDEQDSPPVFVNLPPVVRLSNDMAKGDLLFTVSAEDGDTSNPRSITYSIISDAASKYFQFDGNSNDVILVEDISTIGQENGGSPITLNIQASEIGGQEGTNSSTTAQVILLIEQHKSEAPEFEHETYVGLIEENAPAFTTVRFDGSRLVWDEDQGSSGVFTLRIEDVEEGDGIDRILEIMPPVIVQEGEFNVRVKNTQLLDYEAYQDGEIQFKREYQLKSNTISIVAEDLSEKRLSSSATVTVRLIDVNDNYPVFSKDIYHVNLAEDAKADTLIAQVTATDLDSGHNGEVIYTNLTGENANKLSLDPITGRITLATSEHGFDRELHTDYRVVVVASDRGNPPKTNTTTVIIHITDINDNAPEFRERIYETVLTSNKPQTSPILRVEACDLDEPGTNNSNIRYEILSGNQMNAFEIDRQTGDLRLKEALPVEEASINQPSGINMYEDPQKQVASYELVVRAYDLGVPTQSNTATVYVYLKNDASYLNGTVLYVYPAQLSDVNRDKENIERFLAKLNGVPTVIVKTSVFYETSEDQALGRISHEKTLITANVRYQRQAQVNLEEVNRALPIEIITESGPVESSSSIPSPDTPIIEQVTVPTNEAENAGVSYGWRVALITILVLLCVVLLLLLAFCAYRQKRKLDEKKLNPTESKSKSNEFTDSTDKQELVTKHESRHEYVGPYDQATLRASEQRKKVVVDDPTPIEIDKISVSSGNQEVDNVKRSGGSQKPKIHTPIPFSRHLVNGETQTSQDITDGKQTRGNTSGRSYKQSNDRRPLNQQNLNESTSQTKKHSNTKNDSNIGKAEEIPVKDEEYWDNSRGPDNQYGTRKPRNPLMDKRSMFTIAYQGMQNNQDALKERINSFDENK